MEPKSIALIIAFTALAIALNAVKILTIFYQGAFFQFSQIPIIVAFILFGARIGVSVGLLNLVGGLALFPLPNSMIFQLYRAPTSQRNSFVFPKNKSGRSKSS